MTKARHQTMPGLHQRNGQTGTGPHQKFITRKGALYQPGLHASRKEGVSDLLRWLKLSRLRGPAQAALAPAPPMPKLPTARLISNRAWRLPDHIWTLFAV